MRRKLLCSIPVKRPAYIHSFAITMHYIILIETPFQFYLENFLVHNRPFIENYKWHPKLGTRFIIIDKNNGQMVREIYTEAFSIFILLILLRLINKN